MVCNALATVDFAHSAIGHFIKDVVSIASILRTHSFAHARWQDNFVAYVLAKRARLSFPLLVWCLFYQIFFSLLFLILQLIK